MNTIILIISNIVSIITITLCFVLKVPQIIRLFKAGSSAGLSLNALLVELGSYTTTMLYNYTNGYSWLTYLEYPVLLIQEYIIIGMVVFYSQNIQPSKFFGFILIYGLITTAFAYGILSKFILKLLLPLTLPASVLSKGMQFWEIIRAKNADSVSTVTWLLSVFTNVTRIFTVYVDSADPLILSNFIISSFCSLSVLLATLYYQRGERPQETPKKAK